MLELFDLETGPAGRKKLTVGAPELPDRVFQALRGQFPGRYRPTDA